MSTLDDISVREPERNRFEITLDFYLIGLSVIMMLLGLRQWAIIIGLYESVVGTFEVMNQEWQIATMYLGVVDLVAAVGLWMRVSWGRVVWLLAAVTEILFHTAFIGTYGSNLVIVGLHSLTLICFTALFILANRSSRRV